MTIETDMPVTAKIKPQICRCSRSLCFHLQINQSYSYLYITCQSWLLTYIISHVSACAYARLRFSKQDSGKMFSDLALVILALFVFVWGCMILERRNNNSRERKSTGKPRKRKRVARNHWEDPHYMTQRKPEENTDDESYNMHWRIFRSTTVW